MYCYNVSEFLDPRVFFTLSKDQKSETVTDIKEILSSNAACNICERSTEQVRVISEDEQLVDILKGSSNTESISGGGGKASVFNNFIFS